MTDAIRVPQKRSELRGVNGSVMHSIPEDQRNGVLDLMEDGLTLDEALDVIARQTSNRVNPAIYKGKPKVANPFSPPS